MLLYAQLSISFSMQFVYRSLVQKDSQITNQLPNDTDVQLAKQLLGVNVIVEVLKGNWTHKAFQEIVRVYPHMPHIYMGVCITIKPQVSVIL